MGRITMLDPNPRTMIFRDGCCGLKKGDWVNLNGDTCEVYRINKTKKGAQKVILRKVVDVWFTPDKP